MEMREIENRASGTSTMVIRVSGNSAVWEFGKMGIGQLGIRESGFGKMIFGKLWALIKYWKLESLSSYQIHSLYTYVILNSFYIL